MRTINGRGDVSRVSNELELGVHGVDARKVIPDLKGVCAVPEVNRRDVVEINASLARDVEELNAMSRDAVRQLVSEVEAMGGSVYGGGRVIEDVSQVMPAIYRTTAISDTFGRGMLGINSQQVVIGVSEEQLGLDIYNFFRAASPVIVAMSASSPYHYREDGSLECTGSLSGRIGTYLQACSRFPDAMCRDIPRLNSMGQYGQYLQMVSDQLNDGLRNNSFDTNWAALTGDGIYPFTTIAPHQMLWLIRPRPDHRINGCCEFSVELRMADMPVSRNRIATINSFVMGLSYYIADNGAESVPFPFSDFSVNRVISAARYGLNSNIDGTNLRGAARQLRAYASDGLRDRGFYKEEQQLNKTMAGILGGDTDAEMILRQRPSDATEFRNYLINEMRAEG
jgi:gamma-glutamyl:cysteine ligase YbdK (ATP-grasp superfamily)